MLPLLPMLIAATSPSADQPVVTSWGTIAEPRYPAKICATLPATLTAQRGSIDAADADGARPHPDQARLQAAIDGCRDGAVKLVRGTGGADAFLSSPLVLRSGVSLWIDRNVTLFAARSTRL